MGTGVPLTVTDSLNWLKNRTFHSTIGDWRIDSMKNFEHYRRGYFMPPVESTDWVKKEYIDKAPIWCSVDLRDGNQALVVPMSLDEKIEFYKELIRVGFKEIEIGFPAASETEYVFCRRLIEEDLIPEDVTIQVLTQAREHIIKKTFEAVRGANPKNVIVHVYNSTSVAQREQVFKKSREEIKKIATDGAELLKRLADEDGAPYRFEYSPESFTGTEPEYALEVCNAVLDVWQPTADRKAIINLPATVEMSMPHVYASQIEYLNKNLKYRENVVLSLHPHNDRGCGVADAELGLLAGADRIEGTLFGNGERTGNVDVITLAMNMYTHGVDPVLDFSDMPRIQAAYERLTGMEIYPREPYCGKLVFAAFSGSHQDAIAKGMKYREADPDQMWTVPYLPLNPEDIGRTYDGDVIRINSQSGKGGIGFLLETKYGFLLPKAMKEDVGYTIKAYSDHQHKELQPDEVVELFKQDYVNISKPINYIECHFQQVDGIRCELTMERDGVHKVYHGQGNGRLDAISNALKKHFHIDYTLITYEEHAINRGSNSKACAYVGIQRKESGKVYWGAGIQEDIIVASAYALISAVNRSLQAEQN